ncbi:MAG TPA: hypothetical protein VNL35_10100 [Chloroflexota bacterium]|nr:hypothetical protein [Chloroflexota bacterium]
MEEDPLEYAKSIYGGRVVTTVPDHAIRIGFHYTRSTNAARMHETGIRITKELSNTGGAVHGVNRDGESLYTTTDGNWPYQHPEEDWTQFSVWVDGQIYRGMKKIPPPQAMGFGNVKWWQDDPELQKFITECDVIIRDEGEGQDIKFNPRAVPFLALVPMSEQRADPKFKALRAESGLGQVPKRATADLPEALQRYCLETFKATQSLDNQVADLDQILPQHYPGVSRTTVLQWMKDRGIKGSL